MKQERDNLTPKMPAFLLGLLVMGLLGAPAGGSATTSDTVELTELTVRADLIVDAIATDRVSVWIDGTLLTAVRLEVREVLKGHSTGNITLLLPGGVDLDREIPIAVRWPGAPEIGTGERSLLFLRRIPDEKLRGDHHKNGPYYSIVGFSQGKLEVRPEGEDLVIGGGSGTSGRSRRFSAIKAEIRRTLALRHGEAR